MKHAAESNNGVGFGVVSPDLSAIVLGRNVYFHSRLSRGLKRSRLECGQDRRDIQSLHLARNALRTVREFYDYGFGWWNFSRAFDCRHQLIRRHFDLNKDEQGTFSRKLSVPLTLSWALLALQSAHPLYEWPSREVPSFEYQQGRARRRGRLPRIPPNTGSFIL